MTLAVLVLFPYLQDPGLADANSTVYILLAPLSTIFLLGLLYSWLIVIGAKIARPRSVKVDLLIRFLSEPFHNVVSTIKAVSLSDSARNLRLLSSPRLLLGAAVLVSILIVLIPYRPDLNPTANLVGVDSPLYAGWISQMLLRPTAQALQYSFVEGLEGSRPLLLLLIYPIALAGASASQVIEYLPVLLAPLLSLSTYIFVRYGYGSPHLAALTSLFTPISFYTTVGLWGGYYANWLGLSFAYLFMTCLLLFSKTPSRLNLAAMFSASFALFLAHPWTWVLVVTVSLVFAISLWRETRNRIQLESVIGIILTGIIVDFLKSFVFTTRTVAADIATKSPSGIGSLHGFWNNLVLALLYTHGGFLGNWVILGLGLLAVLALRYRERFERLLMLWIAVPSVPFAIMDSYHQARIVYDLPIPVLMSIAVLFLSKTIRPRLLRWHGILIGLIVLIIANYALQGMLLI
ncbi:MAG TPA: hypothetical protein VE955_05105 [Candidatus Dormibacteraeota bacterium]|jgi:hypothetical protein|nr:hypothetical protein [Candidatus Dormibacteraeota bacterium]